MSESTSSAVECPVCGEAFDPTDAGGWCTNSECGEWQYIGEEVPEPTDEAGDEDLDSDDEEDVNLDPENAVAETNAVSAAETDEEAEPEGESSVASDEPDRTGDAEPIPAIRRIDAGGETSGAVDDGEPTGAVDDGEPIGAVDDGERTGAVDDGAEDRTDGADDESADDPDAVTCPDCGADVAPDDNFCADCGADLDEAVEPTLEACPECGGDVGEDDRFCASCGEDLDAAREALAGDSAGAGSADEAAESLVLRTRGEEIAVADDETVGREVRRILTRTGADEDEAVRIHREHVRFVREDGQFYLVDLGDNPTALNGRSLSKGDREAVGPGDEIVLSDVATISVESP